MSNKNNYIQNFEVKKETDLISVTLTVMHYDDYRCRERVAFNLHDVNLLLQEKNVRVGKCIQNPDLINKRRTSATWIFENPNKKVAKRPDAIRQSSRRKNSKKTQKNLDNIEKDVIIKETITEE
jgi:hypothetical protein